MSENQRVVMSDELIAKIKQSHFRPDLKLSTPEIFPVVKETNSHLWEAPIEHLRDAQVQLVKQAKADFEAHLTPEEASKVKKVFGIEEVEETSSEFFRDLSGNLRPENLVRGEGKFPFEAYNETRPEEEKYDIYGSETKEAIEDGLGDTKPAEGAFETIAVERLAKATVALNESLSDVNPLDEIRRSLAKLTFASELKEENEKRQRKVERITSRINDLIEKFSADPGSFSGNDYIEGLKWLLTEPTYGARHGFGPFQSAKEKSEMDRTVETLFMV